MKILLATSEMTPLAKTGGLADVSGALPRALAALGHDVSVVMPFYGTIDRDSWPFEQVLPEVVVDLPAGRRTLSVWRTTAQSALPGNPVRIYLIADGGLFERPHLYGPSGGDYPDNALRYGYFCLGALWMLKGLGWIPDAIIANDWQTALVPIDLRLHPAAAADPELGRIATLFVIHNISYQGLFADYLLEHLGLPRSAFSPSLLEYYGNINLLKGGILTSDWISTVSPTYAHEIEKPEFGLGLDGVIQDCRGRLGGILNGIDVEDWNPATDPNLPANYSPENMTGKEICKQKLQQRFGLPAEPKVPVIGMVTRLVDQKGIDLVAESLPGLLRGKIQVVMLGSGQPYYHEFFRTLARRFPNKLGVKLGFDEKLARLIEAGSDIFLMPSRFEPCGLNQLYSLRYGTVPIVRRTGGLADSIVNVSARTMANGTATGFSFTHYHSSYMCAELRRALRMYRTNQAAWRRLMLHGMAQDFSWQHAAKEYEKLLTGLVDMKQKR
ncbi:MAG: glycogen synthase GlgA [Candidatus Sumerlaeia bacterium]